MRLSSQETNTFSPTVCPFLKHTKQKTVFPQSGWPHTWKCVSERALTCPEPINLTGAAAGTPLHLQPAVKAHPPGLHSVSSHAGMFFPRPTIINLPISMLAHAAYQQSTYWVQPWMKSTAVWSWNSHIFVVCHFSLFFLFLSLRIKDKKWIVWFSTSASHFLNPAHCSNCSCRSGLCFILWVHKFQFAVRNYVFW